jgi:hypothetical protein
MGNRGSFLRQGGRGRGGKRIRIMNFVKWYKAEGKRIFIGLFIY